MRGAGIVCAIALLAAGCGDDDGRATPGIDAGRDAGRDAGMTGACDCDETEDCAACFANIGRCCYEDETILGAATVMASRCERSPACQVCCSECALMTCEQLRDSDSCPPP